MTAQTIKRVVIVGGGTAGWMAAASISKLIGRDLDVTLVESDEIGTVGVGEATIPTFFALHQLLKINEAEFLSEVQGTIKLGISFENWKNKGQDYIHAFGYTGQSCWAAGFQHFWLMVREARQLNCELVWQGHNEGVALLVASAKAVVDGFANFKHRRELRQSFSNISIVKVVRLVLRRI